MLSIKTPDTTKPLWWKLKSRRFVVWTLTMVPSVMTPSLRTLWYVYHSICTFSGKKSKFKKVSRGVHIVHVIWHWIHYTYSFLPTFLMLGRGSWWELYENDRHETFYPSLYVHFILRFEFHHYFIPDIFTHWFLMLKTNEEFLMYIISYRYLIKF